MKIAIISMIRDNWGGSEELWYEMAKIALREGHTIMHLSFDTKPLHPKMKELVAMGLLAYQRPGFRYSGNSKMMRFFWLGLTFIKKRVSLSFHKIFSQKPDIVIYNGTCYSIANEKVLNNYIKNQKPIFYIIGHLNSDKERGMTDSKASRVREMYKFCRKIFFVSRRSLTTAERHLAINIPNARIIRNPVNMNETAAVKFPDTDATWQFALVGNLMTAHKGQDILLSVLADVEWQNRNFHLNIFGSGFDESYLNELVRFYNLSGKVSFHGRVTDIRGVWKNNHILLMPSHMEGMPLAVVEAMLCGRPVVATDVGGITEWVEDGKNGFIADGATVASLSKAMEKAWENKESWKQMGSDARARAIELYDPNAGNTLLQQILK